MRAACFFLDTKTAIRFNFDDRADLLKAAKDIFDSRTPSTFV